MGASEKVRAIFHPGTRPTLTDVPVRDLGPDDLGKRAVVSRDGSVVEGVLDEFWFAMRPKGAQLIMLTVKGSSGETYQIRSAPLDFRLQIERVEESPEVHTNSGQEVTANDAP